MIPYGRQTIGAQDVQAVLSVLESDWLTQGPTVEHFEAAVSEYVGAKHAVAYSSGTAALHGAAWATGLGPGKIGATSALTFAASAHCLRYVGADIELLDIQSDTYNISLSGLPRVDAVIPVHFAGLPVDMAAIGNERPTVVIEDAAHALGAQTPDGPVGISTHSDVTCFSFHPVKPITSGEGGMAVTNDDEIAERLRRFRSHGIVRKPEQGAWYYEVEELGYHYRMTDIQAALGLSQLQRLDHFIERRNEQAEWYRERLKSLPLVLPPAAPSGFRHGYHLFPVLVEDRKSVFEKLHVLGIGVQVHYVPLHKHPVNKHLKSDHLENVEYIYERILSLPIHPSLGVGQQEYIANSLEDILSE